MNALGGRSSLRVTVGREFAPLLAEQLVGAMFANGTLLANRLLERISPNGAGADIVLEGSSPLVIQCDDPAGSRFFTDERYALPGTDPLRTFKLEGDGRMTFHPESQVIPGRLRVAYLRHIPWPDGFHVVPGTTLELDRVPVLRAVTAVVPDRPPPGDRDLNEGAVWLLTRPPVRYPSSDELRQAAWHTLPAPLRAWVDLAAPAPAIRVEARRDPRTGYAIPTWVVPLRPHPGALAERLDRFFGGVSERLQDQFGGLPIRLEWEGQSDG